MAGIGYKVVRPSLLGLGAEGLWGPCLVLCHVPHSPFAPVLPGGHTSTRRLEDSISGGPHRPPLPLLPRDSVKLRCCSEPDTIGPRA